MSIHRRYEMREVIDNLNFEFRRVMDNFDEFDTDKLNAIYDILYVANSKVERIGEEIYG